MADSGEGPGGRPSTSFLDQTEARFWTQVLFRTRGEKDNMCVRGGEGEGGCSIRFYKGRLHPEF